MLYIKKKKKVSHYPFEGSNFLYTQQPQEKDNNSQNHYTVPSHVRQALIFDQMLVAIQIMCT